MIASAITPEPTVAIVRPASEDMGGEYATGFPGFRPSGGQLTEVLRRPRRRARRPGP
jgi:hypothetical protein